KTAIQSLALADRENAGCRGDSAIANDDAAIVQRRLRMENAQDELNGKIRVQGHARFFVNADRRVAFNREQRAELFVRELRYRFRQIVHRLAFLARQRKNWMTTELGETATQFRLENDNERDGKKHG